MENQESLNEECVKCLAKGHQSWKCRDRKNGCKLKKSVELKPVRVAYECPKCGKGDLEFTGVSNLSYPPQNEHRCTNKECDLLPIYFSGQYPNIEYRYETFTIK